MRTTTLFAPHPYPRRCFPENIVVDNPPSVSILFAMDLYQKRRRMLQQKRAQYRKALKMRQKKQREGGGSDGLQADEEEPEGDQDEIDREVEEGEDEYDEDEETAEEKQRLFLGFTNCHVKNLSGGGDVKGKTRAFDPVKLIKSTASKNDIWALNAVEGRTLLV